jgi:putative ABC transport system permease protein
MSRILLLKSVRDLRKSLAQSLALIVISMLGVSSFIALIGAYRDLGTSYNHAYDQLKFADVTYSLASAPQSVVDDLGQIQGVQAVTGRLIVDGGMPVPASSTGGNGAVVRARLIGIPADQHPTVNDVLVEQGSYFQSTDVNPALLESHFADLYHLKPGDTLAPIIDGKAVPLKISGVVASPEYLIVSASRQDAIPSARSLAVMFVPLAEAQQVSGMTSQINDVSIRFTSGADHAATIDRINQVLAPYHVVSTTLKKDQPSNAALRLDLDGYREIAFLMPGLILLVSAASLYVMLGRQIRAQQSQIGLMKALGYSTRAVELHYLGTAIAIALIGALLGIAAGIPLEHALTSAYATELGIPLVQTRIYLDILGLSLLLSLIAALLGAFGPTRQVARLEPASAMRPNPSAAGVTGRAAIFERFSALPVWTRMSLRNVLRGRRRTLTTGLGVIFAFVLILMGWSLIDSMNYVTHRHFNTVERWDEVAVFRSLQPGSVNDQISRIDGVTQVEPFMQLPATVSAGNTTQELQLNGLPTGQNLHALQLPSGVDESTALASGHIVLTTPTAKALGVGVGDTVTVTNQYGTHQLTVSATVDELLSSVAYVSLTDAQSWTGQSDNPVNAAYVRVDPGMQDQVQARLYNLPGMASVQLKSALKSDWSSLMGLFYALIGAILAFAVVMAFALLFNTMTVNVLERERELATMRAVGSGRGMIALLLSTESVMLWALATIPGLLLGYLVAMQMGNAFQSDLFNFTIVINPITYIATAVGILLTMIVAAFPAIRRVNRLNLAEATKVLS